jgi:hypothetical protein
MSSTRYVFGSRVLYRIATVLSVAATTATPMAFLGIRTPLIQAATGLNAAVNLKPGFPI